MNSQSITTYLSVGFIAWCLISALCWPGVPCTTKYLTAAACIGGALLLMCICCLAPSKWRGYIIPSLILSGGIFEASYGLCQMFGFAASGHHLYAVTGTFANPGPYGGFLAVCAACALCLCKKHGSKLFWCVASLMCLMIFVSMSRAAMAAVLVSACVLWRSDIKRNWKWLLPMVLAAAAVLYVFKSGSANGRIFMAFMGFEAWKDAFWLGNGPGTFLQAISNSEIRWFSTNPHSSLANWAGVAEYPFCEPSKIAVEYGAVGLLLFLGMVVCASVSLWKKSAPTFFGLLSLCVFSLFSYPLSLWPFMLTMVTFIAEAITPEKSASKSKSIVCGLLGLSMVGISLSMLKPYWQAQHEYAKFSYTRHPAFIKDYYRLLPLMLEDRRFLFAFGQTLRDVGRYNDSNDMLSHCERISNDPMITVLIGRNYEDMGAIYLAEERYLDAYRMQPNRIYPLYRLMKMHQARGDTAKCMEYAHAVATFMPKLTSPATRDMQTEAINILKHLSQK